MDEMYIIEIEVSKGQYKLLKDIRDILNRNAPEGEGFTLPRTVHLLIELGLKKMEEEVEEKKKELKNGL